MEKSTSTDFRLNAICPKCGELVDVEITVKTAFKVAEPEEEKEAKTDAGKEEKDVRGDTPAESSNVRLIDTEGKPGAGNTAAQPADSGKGRRAKKPGGEKQ